MSEPYGRGSRYRRVPTVTRTDRTGRTVQADAIRERPVAPGTFVHTVCDGDRLDHLAQRYYGKPHMWWPIADANPEFASPLALLGLDPITRARVRGAVTPAALTTLRMLAGVEDVALDDRNEPSSLVVTYNRATVGPQELARAAGVTLPDVLPVGHAGTPIVVPPEPAP